MVLSMVSFFIVTRIKTSGCTKQLLLLCLEVVPMVVVAVLVAVAVVVVVLCLIGYLAEVFVYESAEAFSW